MTVFLTKKIAWAIATLVVASLVVFAALEIVPGDPAQVMLGINASDDAVAALRESLGLNKPVMERYFSWISGMVTGDFGKSYTYSVPVSELVAGRITISLPLALLALFISTAIAIPVGLFAAARRGGLADTGIMALTQIGIAIPNFWFALLLVYVLAIWLQLVPAGGFPGWDAGFLTALKALLLPAVSLALPQAAILSRVTRSALLETMGEDYIRTARAKGLSTGATLWKHAPAQCNDSRFDNSRPAIRLSSCRNNNHRKCILPARAWATGISSDFGTRPYRSRKCRDDASGNDHRHQLCGRPRLSVDRPSFAAPQHMIRFLQSAMRNRSFAPGFAITCTVAMMAAISYVWTPFDVTHLDIAAKLQSPGTVHWFGTDHFGRDIFSMIMVGSRNSIAVALVAVVIGVGIGVPLGCWAAARGGFIDEALMRGNDVVFAFPALLSAVMITAIFGPGAVNAIIAIGIFNIPVFARLARGAAMALWPRDFILAARAAGKSASRITVEHIIPNMANIIIVQATIAFALGIIQEAGLAYVGLGTQPPFPSWGKMLNEAQTMMRFAPHMAIVPGLAIVVTVLGLNLLGDGLRDLLDPRLTRKRD